jgi:acetoin utilization deacetylase AcuC-like enzyme
MPASTPRSLAFSLVPSPEHDLASHPENTGRFQHFDRLHNLAVKESLVEIDPSPAALDSITAVHPQDYLDALKEAIKRAPGYIDYAPTYVTPHSFESALLSAGGVLNVLEAVVKGEMQAGFALNRPPGHHATARSAMGFCLLNNVAIAARQAQERGFQRVMIVDFDVHHGNGTQAILEDDPNVLFVSTHQSGIYPGSGQLHDTGPHNGVVNIPLPAGAGDAAFQTILDEVVRPLAARFVPDFLLVSAGFDAHWRDPLAGLQISSAGYHAIAKALGEIAREHCDGKVLAVLEGGYDPEALVYSVMAVIQGLRGADFSGDPLGLANSPEPDASALIQSVKALHGIN